MPTPRRGQLDALFGTRCGPAPLGVLPLAGQYLRRARGERLAVDHFIPIHEKWIEDLRRWPRRSPRAALLRLLDGLICWSAPAIVVDTEEHAHMLHRSTLRALERFVVVPPPPQLAPTLRACRDSTSRVRFVWMGSLLPFQGFDVIAATLNSLERPNYEVTILTSVAPAVALPTWVELLPRMTADAAGEVLADADVALGVFGGSPKFDRCVPFKLVDALASGKPVITGRSRAAHALLGDQAGVVWIEPRSPRALAEAMARLASRPDEREQLGRCARERFDQLYGPAAEAGWRRAVDNLLAP